MKHKSLIVELAEVIARHWPGRDHVLRRLARALVPHPGTLIVTLLVVAGLLWAASVGALPLRAPLAASTSTGTIAYQGRLADADGNPLTDTYNMIFRLYDAASGGVPLWEEQWTGSNGVQVSDGLFNVMLGSLASIPQSVITGNDSLFLGITVGTDDEMTPRVQLGSVPFAVQALTVPDGSVTTEKIADEAVTQAKLGPDISLEPPDGSITTAKIADGAVTSAKLAKTDGHIALVPDANKLVKTATLRQDDATDNYKNNQVILTGWGFVRGDGEQLYKGGSVSFGLTFSEVPIVIVGALGRKDNSDPVSIEDLATEHWFSVRAYNVTSTGFDIMVSSVHSDTGPIPTSARIGWSWIAIGTLD